MGNYLANECRCICHSNRFGLGGDLGCVVYHSKSNCYITCIKMKCKRCKAGFLDEKVCSASGFSLFCAAEYDEYYHVLEKEHG